MISLGLDGLWKAAAAGAGLFVFCTWLVGTWLNWRVNNRVHKDLEKVIVLLALIEERDLLDRERRKGGHN